MSTPILPYTTPAEPVDKLTLEEKDGFVQVTFPAPAQWTYIVGIVIGMISGLAHVLAAILIWLTTHHLPDVPETTIRELFFICLLYWAWAAEEWWKYRRFGRVSTILRADGTRLVRSKLIWWRIREKIWPVDGIKSVELRPVRWQIGRKKVTHLRFHRLKGRSLNFVLKSADPEFPLQIAFKFAAAMNRPLLSKDQKA